MNNKPRPKRQFCKRIFPAYLLIGQYGRGSICSFRSKFDHIIVFGLIIFLLELFPNKFYLHLCLVKMCITISSLIICITKSKMSQIFVEHNPILLHHNFISVVSLYRYYITIISKQILVTLMFEQCIQYLLLHGRINQQNCLRKLKYHIKQIDNRSILWHA